MQAKLSDSIYIILSTIGLLPPTIKKTMKALSNLRSQFCGIGVFFVILVAMPLSTINSQDSLIIQKSSISNSGDNDSRIGTNRISGNTNEFKESGETPYNAVKESYAHSKPPRANGHSINSRAVYQMIDFTAAAERSVDAVVHIYTTQKKKYNWGNKRQDRLYDMFKNTPGSEDNTSGSGVIISKDGYIVTNYHVVKESNYVEVTLNNKQVFTAEVMGNDPTTDLALLKIDATNLPTLPFADSDNIKVGQWVLAVGNPFNLNSTVTAGIISAKGRDIDILDEENAIESFIQTDAVVNQGNSGGALVNLDGELVGINTAIATPSGSFAGYGFAVPSNIASKVVDDLKEFKSVQRAYLGTEFDDVTPELANRMNLTRSDGVLIKDVTHGSSADRVGLKKGDVVFKLNNQDIRNSTQFQEKMAQFRPGEPVMLGYVRDGEESYIAVVLRNRQNSTSIILDKNLEIEKLIGAKVEELGIDELRRANLNSGIRVYNITKGIFQSNTLMRDGYILLSINKEPVTNSNDFYNIMDSLKSGDIVVLQGAYAGRPGNVYYSFGMP